MVFAAIPAATQTTRTDTPTSTRAWTPSLTPDGQPDLQGVWSDVSITPLERPLVLQGRQFLTDQEVSQLKARAERLFGNAASDFVGGDNLFLALLANADTVENPNATGSALNMVLREFDNRTSLITDPADGRLPALTPEGRRRVTANQVATLTLPWQFDQSASAQPRQLPPGRPRPNGADDLSTQLRCISWGVPKIAGNANYTSHYEIFQGPGFVVFLSEVNHEARVIPLDGRPHLPQSIRQWNGDSRVAGKDTRSSSRRRTLLRRATSWDRPIVCISSSASRESAPTGSTTRSRSTMRPRGQSRGPPLSV